MTILKDNIQYVIQRSDKICLALYVLTTHIKDIEPLKWSLRNHVIGIVSYINKLIDTRDGERQVLVDMSIKEIHLLLSEMNLSIHAGLISQNNGKVIVEEIQSFSRELKEFIEKDIIVSPLQREHMHVELPAPLPEKITTINKRHNKGHVLLNIKDSNNLKDKRTDGQHDERRKVIVEMLKNKDFLSVKDIAMSIKNCSEKTVQRELISLVKDGVLYKTGERRWSVYALAKKASVEPL